MEKLPVEKAIGRSLAHDLTEVNPYYRRKCVAFCRGHVISEQDLEVLKQMGKRHLYVGPVDTGQIHEDQVALTLAPYLAGPGIGHDRVTKEGKVNFRALDAGLFRVDIERLTDLNRMEVPSMPTIHDRFPVVEGKVVAAFRIIPLTCSESVFERMKGVAETPLIWLDPYVIQRAAIVVTGSEVYSGAVEDRFVPRLRYKLQQLGVETTFSTVVPDDRCAIAEAVRKAEQVAELVLVTGGTSVDPDDVTFQAMADVGVTFQRRGNPVQPGNHMSLGRKSDRVYCSVPAAALHFQTTALDLFLPRLLTGDMPTDEELASAGHGGLCHFCEPCVYPVCPFGRF